MYREHDLLVYVYGCGVRFIPMCIGNTKNVMSNSVAYAVYPYVYREHRVMVFYSPD